MEKLIKPEDSIEEISEKTVEAFCEKDGNNETCVLYNGCFLYSDASSEEENDILF